MKISARAEYACLAVIELAKPARDGAPRRIREIAAAQAIPERYLVQILLQLKAAGLVHSIRGSVGGYHLARSAETITIADVISAIDGAGDPPRKAVSPAAQDLEHLFERAQAAERQILSEAPVSQFVRPDTHLDWVL